MIDDLRFVLTKKCPLVSSLTTNRNVRDAYDKWVKANEKDQAYILASILDVLTKKQENMVTAKEIMESLQAMFEQLSKSIRHETLKYIYNCHMKEWVSIREHVLDMMVDINVAQANGIVIDEKSQVSFIMESLQKIFLQN
ncbi:uncharacterized protein LOC120084074 [Benincasa hispida]|uniref:uncharacterized protein LOC120084074 n=1 Tax=Benincasa hispida TaxID=102211 RepID=UPI0019009FCB|nr:uncharacterized protein LOC120084074 [Benincasa hispida]